MTKANDKGFQDFISNRPTRDAALYEFRSYFKDLQAALKREGGKADRRVEWSTFISNKVEWKELPTEAMNWKL